jgi:hypothetical protein
MSRSSRQGPKPPSRESLAKQDRTGRRLVIGGIGAIGAALVGLTAGIPLLFPDAQKKQRLDNRRIVLPLLRARMELRPLSSREARQRGTPPGELPEEEVLLVLNRAEMRDWDAPDDSPARRESLEIRAYLADDIWYAQQVQVAVVEPGGAPGARLIAAQGGTAWVWADQLIAAGPGWMGRTMDQAELLRLNPDLGLDRPGLGGRLGLAEALILDAGASGRGGFAFDPATRIAAPRGAPRAAPWPPLYTAPAFAGPAIAREGRIGATWFGLLPAEAAITGAVSAQDAAGAFLPLLPEAGPARLWRGRLRGIAAGEAPAPAATDVLEAAEPVPGVAPIVAGGLVMAGRGRLLGLADPPSILLAEIGEVGGLGEKLRRLRLDGTPVWDLALPTTHDIRTALVEPGRLWLLASPRGMFETLYAIALADGRLIRTRHLA